MKIRGDDWQWRSILARFDKPWAGTALLFIVLLLLLPPDGVLSDNEENYFQLASQAITGVPGGPDSGVFDGSHHRYLSELFLGHLISLTGFEITQILTRVLSAATFALILPRVFGMFALSALDGAITVILFDALGQNLIGGEWIFFGFESKVVAYAFILAALYAIRTRRELVTATALCVAATYFHFLVGIFWFFALLALRLIENRREATRVAIAALGFIVATAPQTGMIIWTRLNAPTSDAADTPPPDVIFSLLREPWHGAPFVGPYHFVVDWLPGYLLAAAMLAGCIVVARSSRVPAQRTFARWLSLIIAYLFLVLVPAFIERDTGALGKFYPFRPSSLVLLLWLTLAMAWINGLVKRHLLTAKLLTLALIAPSFLSGALSRVMHDDNARTSFATDKQAITRYLAASSTTDAVVLIDPAIETSFLDFERRTGRPSLVSWKFAPTNDPDLREWYRRIEFRKSLFQNGCPQNPAYRAEFLLSTPAGAATLSQSCGPVVLETTHWRLLRRVPPADP
jgi:hypothetical protein